jgi:hypothetical protein
MSRAFPPNRVRRPSPGLEKLLGLTAPKPTPADVVFREHAAGRFQERVRPHMTRPQVREHLPELAVKHGRITTRRPTWIGPERVEERRYTTVGYLLIHSGVPTRCAFPLMVRDGRLTAQTCLIPNKPRRR